MYCPLCSGEADEMANVEDSDWEIVRESAAEVVKAIDTIVYCASCREPLQLVAQIHEPTDDNEWFDYCELGIVKNGGG